jgi:hypothetical protein
MTTKVVQEESWENGDLKVGFKIIWESGEEGSSEGGYVVEVFELLIGLPIRVTRLSRASDLVVALFACEGVKAGFYAAGFKPLVGVAGGELTRS